MRSLRCDYYRDSASDSSLRIQELPPIRHRGGYTDPANGAWAPAPVGVALRTLLMPYGVWTCTDGREVLFNRAYRPLWQRQPGEAPRPADRREWVAGIAAESFYYSDRQPEAARQAAASAALAAWGRPAPSAADLVRGGVR